MYGLRKEGTTEKFLNDVSRHHARLINDDPELLDNKSKFYSHLQKKGFENYLPNVYGYIKEGEFRGTEYTSINQILEEQNKIVIKKCTGGGGNEVYIGEYRQGEIKLETKGNKQYTLNSKINSFEDHIVTEYCEQASYIERVYPDAANTIRILTLKTEEGNVIMPAAMHRIGTDYTGILDNFSQGGISAAIDVKTGELSAAVGVLRKQEMQWHEKHPDTGEEIKGITVPGWRQIKRQLQEVAKQVDADYVGWDIIVTDSGEFKIIEGNSYPNLRSLQVHEPLLDKEEVREFFQTNGII